MEISSTSSFAALTLKLTKNSRSDLVLTTLPVADLANPVSAVSLVFPHIAIVGEFSTRLIFINADQTAASAGVIGFRQSDGSAMTVPLGPSTAGDFPFRFSAGGGGQLAPGTSTTPISALLLIDPSETSSFPKT
jgi:hypothetical protein